VLPWPILPWTSQAACRSSQTIFHPFSRYYMSRASLSRCVACKTVIHKDFWNRLCVCFGRPGLVRIKIGTTEADTRWQPYVFEAEGINRRFYELSGASRLMSGAVSFGSTFCAPKYYTVFSLYSTASPSECRAIAFNLGAHYVEWRL
jgi:hypothetical protein